MSLRKIIAVLFLIGSASLSSQDKEPAPNHLMVGPGIFDVDQKRPRFLALVEYRWEVNCHHLRPLVGFFMATDQNFFMYGGLGYDIFLGKKFVLTPSFSPGIYIHNRGKNLGFPVNFRSALELSYILKNQARVGAQFNHISNARMLHKNPGADSLIFYYAIPFPNTVKKK